MKKFVIGAVVGGAIAVGWLVLSGAKKDRIEYRTEPVTRGDIVTAVTASGAVNAITTVQVGTQVSGSIRRLADNARQEKARSSPGSIPLFRPRSARPGRTSDRQADLVRPGGAAEGRPGQARELWPSTSPERARRSQTAFFTAVATVSRRAINRGTLAADEPRHGHLYVDGIAFRLEPDRAHQFQADYLRDIKMQINTSVDEADVASVASTREVEFGVDAPRGGIPQPGSQVGVSTSSERSPTSSSSRQLRPSARPGERPTWRSSRAGRPPRQGAPQAAAAAAARRGRLRRKPEAGADPRSGSSRIAFPAASP
jgi:HlyD family secretion protein